MTGKAKDNLDLYCEMTGQKPSEVARAGIALLMGPYLNSFVGQVSDRCQTKEGDKKVPVVRQVSDNPHVRPRVDRLDLSNDKSSCRTEEKKKEVQTWFKAFWLICENRKFPDRVNRTIKDRWDILKERDPAELGRIYNEYCQAESGRGREYKHPNSWLNDGGYDNEVDKTNENGGMDWDVE
jgi:hypothetical protein